MILGVPVDVVTMDQALQRMAEFVAAGTPHLVATADASGIAQAQTDDQLKSIYERADLVTPDSFGVLWAAKRKGAPIAERVSGVDIVSRVCEASASSGARIYFLGAAPGVAEAARSRVCSQHPGCQIVGTHDGYFPPEEDIKVAQEIAATRPDYLFVAMGIPRQEKFILATMETIRAGVAMGVGGTFDVLSGNVKRAPKLIRQMKMEWAWRLLQNPKKLAKVMMLPRFVGYVLHDKK